MKYLSTFEAAEKWGLSPRRVGVLCNENRIPGAQRAGSRWIIPEDAEKPKDARIKSGKYIKKTERGLGYGAAVSSQHAAAAVAGLDEGT